MARSYGKSDFKKGTCRSFSRSDFWPARCRQPVSGEAAAQLLFQALAGDSALANLPQSLTINGTTVTGSFIYEGKNVSAGNPWTATVGDNLLIAPAGSPSFSAGVPLTSTTDFAVTPNLTSWQAASSAFADIGTDDFVFEGLIKVSPTTARAQVFYTTTTNVGGWWIRTDNERIQALFYDTDNDLTILGTGIGDTTLSTWYHFMIFGKQGSNAALYVNGEHSATSAAILDGTYTNNHAVKAVGRNTIAFMGMWQSPSWLDTHLQADLAKERFHRLCGIYPQVATGTALATTSTRAFDAHLETIEANGNTQLYKVGSEWMRLESRKDANGDSITGFLSELQVTNLLTGSQEFDNTDYWSQDNLASVSGNVGHIKAPDGTYTCDGIVRDAVSTNGYVWQTGSATDESVYTQSIYARSGSVEWMRAVNTASPTVACYFHLSGAGDTGVQLNTDSVRIKTLGDSWYRCEMTWTATATAATQIQFRPALADNDDTFAGDGSTVQTYLWGAQIEETPSNYVEATSYIHTTTAARTRLKDQLAYPQNAASHTGKGSMYCKILGRSKTGRFLRLHKGAADYYRFAIPNGTARLLLTAQITAGIQASLTSTSDITDGTVNTAFSTWKQDDFKMYVDGADEKSDTSGTPPDAMTLLYVGCAHGWSAQPNALIGDARVYNKPIEYNDI